MKRLALILFVLVFATSLEARAAESKLVLYYVGSKTCGKCMEIEERLLRPLVAAHGDKLEIRNLQMNEPKDLPLLDALEKDYQVANPLPQELFFPNRALLGYDAIMADGGRLINEYLADPQKWHYARDYAQAADAPADAPAAAQAVQERVSHLTLIGLFAVGFVDGINPCAIATMIFLISFLGTQHRTRADTLKIGLAFTGTVFVTYFAIGLGTFRILSLIDQMYWVAMAIRVFAAGLATVVAIMSIWDAIHWYRTHDTERMKVQLPKGIKLAIHSVIRGNLTSRKIIIGAVVSGFLVTLLAGVCTAKVYLPTIVAMTHAVGFRLQGWLLLVLYNLLFVLPLLIVMISAAYGMKWQRLSKFTQNHMALAKVLLALVLLGLAVFISVGN